MYSSITIGGYPFEGPYSNTIQLQNRSGVYAILAKKTNGNYRVVDIGESATVKDRIDSHDRKGCWTLNGGSDLSVAVHYTPGLQHAGRMEIEQALRAQYNPPCGIQ